MKQIAALSGLLFSDIAVTKQRPPQFEMEIRTIKLTDGFYALEGVGGNVAVFVWDEGVLLFDYKLAASASRDRSSSPNTSWRRRIAR